MKTQTVPVKPYTKSQICAMYKITLPTLRVWFKRAKIPYNKNIRIFTPLEVSNLFNSFGFPYYNENGKEVEQ